jgi:hypothetical protein
MPLRSLERPLGPEQQRKHARFVVTHEQAHRLIVEAGHERTGNTELSIRFLELPARRLELSFASESYHSCHRGDELLDHPKDVIALHQVVVR